LLRGFGLGKLAAPVPLAEGDKGSQTIRDLDFRASDPHAPNARG